MSFFNLAYYIPLNNNEKRLVIIQVITVTSYFLTLTSDDNELVLKLTSDGNKLFFSKKNKVTVMELLKYVTFPTLTAYFFTRAATDT